MAVTVTEASAINTLLRYVTGTPGAGGVAPDPDQARSAAAILARSAHRTLAAGLREDDIALIWPDVPSRPG